MSRPDRLTAAMVGMAIYRVRQLGPNPFITGRDQDQMVNAIDYDHGVVTIEFAGMRVFFLAHATLCFEETEPDPAAKEGREPPKMK